MSTVLEIEDAVAKLAEPEFQTFAAWFDQTRASSVDDAFESAILGGHFDEMATRAIRYHQAGKTIAFDGFIRRHGNASVLQAFEIDGIQR
jgi:hypothetical protein